MMGDLSVHFSAREFRCPCPRCTNKEPKVSARLVDALERLRAHPLIGGRPVRIISGYRCGQHNKEVDGARDSQHLNGTGADIAVDGVAYADLVTACEQVFSRGGMGTYPHDGHVHVDVRGYKARWQG